MTHSFENKVALVTGAAVALVDINGRCRHEVIAIVNNSSIAGLIGTPDRAIYPVLWLCSPGASVVVGAH